VSDRVRAKINRQAPGAPGLPARWAPGPKDGVGTAMSDQSNVWFTIGHGILNEVFYPQVDTPSTSGLGLIVTADDDYFSEEALNVDSIAEWEKGGIPAFSLTNTSHDGRYVIRKQIVSDPDRPVVLQRIQFEPGHDSVHHLYAFLTPHLGGMGDNNTAWIVERNGRYLLLAERDSCVVALASSAPFLKCSAGFVGRSDGRLDLKSHKCMTEEYDRASNGNTALTAEIDCSGQEFVLALGFGETSNEAIGNALDSLSIPFRTIFDKYVEGWHRWINSSGARLPQSASALAYKSLTTLKVHESKNPGGGLVAGLATPWGSDRGDDDKIGYHVIWTRDMVEAAGSLLAIGASEGIHRYLRFLKNVQQDDGHWPQNMWTDGTPFWNGIQMDETALPILLVNLARREGEIKDSELQEYWPMVRAAASYLLRNGPVTPEDRWEEDPGYTPFTLAAEIAGLLAAADMAEVVGEPLIVAEYMRDVADTWYFQIDSWLYAKDTDWSKQLGVRGYYQRIASVAKGHVGRFEETVQVKNVRPGESSLKAEHLISPDALALVRFGLRDADDPRMLDTVKAIDELLKIETPCGTTWHRYNNDGYGEHSDGTAFDGIGIGRGWPLLTGERAHYELALGNSANAEKLKSDMERFAGNGGLLPEQVWDSDPIPAHNLTLGRPTGSAMPLAWAHGEYLKLLRSLADQHIFDCPPQTIKRYLKDGTVSKIKSWRFNHKIHAIRNDKTLRIETLAAATVHWTVDGWNTTHDAPTHDTSLGVYFVDIGAEQLAVGAKIMFTFYWHHSDVWEKTDFTISVSRP